MAATQVASDSSGPRRFALDDPTLPAPWKGLIDGSTLYYWNPDTNVTQYERPAAAAPPLPAGPPPGVSTSMPASSSGAFSHHSMQLGQVGQASQKEHRGQTIYPQVNQLVKQQQQLQQPGQHPPFQHADQHQAAFQQVKQLPYQQQQTTNQQVSQQTPAPQYSSAHPQSMQYQHGPYKQQQQGPQYSYKVNHQSQMPQGAYNPGQQHLIPQTAYNQGQQLPIPQAAYNQGQQPPVPQGAYNHGQQPPMPQAAYNQGQQPQKPHTTYNQGEQPQGISILQTHVQHPPQSPILHQPAQASQVLQASHSQELQMPSHQGQLQHDFPLTSQHGKQQHHGHMGAQLSQLSHGQQSSMLKFDEVGGHEGKRTSFSLPCCQQCGQALPSDQQLPSNHQLPGAHNQLNNPGIVGPSYSLKHHAGGSSPGEASNMRFLSLPAQMHQSGADTTCHHQPASGHAVVNHIGSSQVRPAIGVKMGNGENHFERNDAHSAGRFDGINVLQQLPKLAALPPSQNHLDLRIGPIYPQPDYFVSYKMATLKREFDALRMKDGEALDDYAAKLSGMMVRYTNLGATLEDSTLVKKLLDTVPFRFYPAIAGIEQFCDISTMAYEEALGFLKTFDERLRLRESGSNHDDQLLTAAEWQARQKQNGRDSGDKKKSCGYDKAGGSGSSSSSGSHDNTAASIIISSNYERKSEWKKRKRYNLRSSGHLEKEEADKGIRCYNCNLHGHISKDCSKPNKREALLATADEEPEVKVNKEPEGNKAYRCYNCNKLGHIAKDCRKVRLVDKKKCYNCRVLGHFAKDCPEP